MFPDPSPRVVILLAAYQGARFIRAQLDSLVAQRHGNWRLVVADDGSGDGTPRIVRQFARDNPGRDVTLISGPRQGATRNFLGLVAQVEPREWLAWCDQDDLWLPDRLSRGIGALRDRRGPAAHACRTIICGQDLVPLGPAPLFCRAASFRNALVQACLPGNTTLCNAAAAALMRRAASAAAAAGVVSHDWWTYQLLTGAGAAVIRDPAQTVLYRQHPGNVMGRNDTLHGRAARLTQLGKGDYGAWLHANQRALTAAHELLTPENRALLDGFGRALRVRGPQAALLLVRLGVYRQTRAGTAALLAAALAGRLRDKAPSA